MIDIRIPETRWTYGLHLDGWRHSWCISAKDTSSYPWSFTMLWVLGWDWTQGWRFTDHRRPPPPTPVTHPPPHPKKGMWRAKGGSGKQDGGIAEEVGPRRHWNIDLGTTTIIDMPPGPEPDKATQDRINRMLDEFVARAMNPYPPGYDTRTGMPGAYRLPAPPQRYGAIVDLDQGVT